MNCYPDSFVFVFTSNRNETLGFIKSSNKTTLVQNQSMPAFSEDKGGDDKEKVGGSADGFVGWGLFNLI